MGIPLLREAFEAIESMPGNALFRTEIVRKGGIAELKRAVLAVERAAKDGEVQTERLMTGLSSMLREAIDEGSPRSELVAELEWARSWAENRRNGNIEREGQVRVLADSVHASVYRVLFGDDADVFLRQSKRLHELIRSEIDIGSKLIDFLTVTIADIDPEARGGPTFDNADDLIAYLHG